MTVLCTLNDIPEQDARGFSVGDTALVAVKKDGQLYVYRNECPHLGVNLEFQPDEFLDADKALIQCATHGALFLIESGECVQGPCRGDHLIPVDFTLEGEQVVVQL